MRKNLKQRLAGVLTAAAAAASAIGGFPVIEASAATSWKYDLGGSGAASGYTAVSASDAYSSSRGYGFSGSVSNIAAGGSGAGSDAVKFSGGEFRADLPKGLYQITVTTGNSPRTSIMIEGMYQMINLTGNNAVETVQVPVTDGTLNISAVAGMAGRDYTISAIDITQLNTTGDMKPTIWICGDSTVANYYNTADTAQHGWGQYLKNYVNTGVFEVRNQASSGQYAAGFYNGGQFEPIKAYGKAGDYYIISIGINDTNPNYTTEDEYVATVTKMVQEAKQRGMNVILVKQQGRKSDLTRNSLLGGRWFGGDLDKIGAAENVTVIDDFTAWQDFGLSIGADAMTEYYAADDDLHQSAKGAQKNAELIAGLMKIGQADFDTSLYYTFKNTNSGLVMDIEGGKLAEGTNLQQWGDGGYSTQKWQLTPFSGGTYYYIRSAADPNYVLKAMTGSDGGNIELVPYANNDSMMLFQFTKVGDGSYYISTRSSRDACFVEIANASTGSGANVQQYSYTYNKCQNWQAVIAEAPAEPQQTEPAQTEPQPSETEPSGPQPGQPQPSQNFLLGDLDGSGTVTAADLSVLKSGVFGAELSVNQKLAADVTGDSAVTADDVLLHRDYLLGKATEFVAYTEKYYFAVDQEWSEGVIESTNEGFTDPRGYINLDNNDTSNITFTVNVPAAGNYMTHIRFANGSADDRQMKVYVNGNTEEFWLQSFTGTGSWTTWTEFSLVLPLQAGTNTIQFVSALAGKGGPNLDYITLTLTDEPYGETYDPNSYQQMVDANKPTLFILGDSTVQSYRASYAPQQGWGYYMADYFTDGINVDNRSMAGRSTKKAYDEGRWQGIADSMKAGDYVMIMFAINDAGKANADRYAPVCGDVNNPTEGSYEWYMTQFINDTKAKGGTPILVTTVIGMGAWNSSSEKFVNSYTDYCNACKSLASKHSIPIIDLNTIMVNHYNSVGYDTAKSYHLIGAVEGSTDGTHFCEKGANIVAGLVANAVKSQKIAGLYTYVK